MKNCIVCGQEFNRCKTSKRKRCFNCNPIKRLNTELSEKILELRSGGMGQKEIARFLKCSSGSVSYWCGGDEVEQAKPIHIKNYCSCGKKLSSRVRQCINCITVDKPIKDLMYDTGPQSNTYGKIRARARNFAKRTGLCKNGCQKCGYKKHVEVCHIKPVSSFDPETMISIVNDVSNLAVLCPNCHWEFDHPNIK